MVRSHFVVQPLAGPGSCRHPAPPAAMEVVSMRSTKLATAIVLTLAMAGGFACSEDTGGGGGIGGRELRRLAVAAPVVAAAPVDRPRRAARPVAAARRAGPPVGRHRPVALAARPPAVPVAAVHWRHRRHRRLAGGSGGSTGGTGGSPAVPVVPAAPAALPAAPAGAPLTAARWTGWTWAPPAHSLLTVSDVDTRSGTAVLQAWPDATARAKGRPVSAGRLHPEAKSYALSMYDQATTTTLTG